MRLQIVRFLALLLAALALVPSLAHLLEMPGKMGMSKLDYFVAQQLYRGWAFLGIVVIGALVLGAWLAFLERRNRGAFVPALLGTLCIAGTQVVFWAFTYPVNAATAQWQMMPTAWMALRRQWELSHAASAILNLLALVLLIVAALRGARSDQLPA